MLMWTRPRDMKDEANADKNVESDRWGSNVDEMKDEAPMPWRVKDQMRARWKMADRVVGGRWPYITRDTKLQTQIVKVYII